MKLTPILVFMSSAGLIVGCQARDTQKQTKEVETTTETTKSGEPVKSETEVRQKTPDGKSDMKNETYVGTKVLIVVDKLDDRVSKITIAPHA